MRPQPHVLVERRGRLGLLTLNRPEALNALTHEMVLTLAAALGDWASDDRIAAVAVVGAGGRGLCAGGDVVALHLDVTAGDGTGAAGFWRDEYALNAQIAGFPKPFVAVQDGIVLGGGVGVSAHGSHRVVTETSRIGFPETAIGFVPDVGATWLLSRVPGELGTRIALSGESVGAADAITVGLADAFVPRARIPGMLQRLESEDVESVLEDISEAAPIPERPTLASQQIWAEEAFAGRTVPEILARLRSLGIAEASALARRIDAMSPLALAVTLQSVRRAGSLPDLGAALAREYRVSGAASMAPDFAEGVRAKLIDKDGTPKWSPAHHSEVDQSAVEQFFTQPADGDLALAPGTEGAIA